MKLHDIEWDSSNNQSLYDMIPTQELDVRDDDDAVVLEKSCAPSKPAKKLTKREQELASIEEFLRQKRERERLSPTPPPETKEVTVRTIGRRFGQGRPRKHVMKEVTFVQLENGDLRLAGRGRPSAKLQRVKIKLHYRWAQRLSQNSTYSADEVENMKTSP
tara:strand:+ start:4669 stop:5151 length:483 start_codon:yes stop_codon:yes gene_type:complete